MADPGTCELEAGLQYMRSALKTAAHEAKLARAKEESNALLVFSMISLRR